MSSLAQALSNRLTAAMLSYNILKKGNVALGGSTGAVLGRSLRGLRDILNVSLAEVRLESGVEHRRRVAVLEMIGEVEIEASLEASARGLALVVTPGERGVDVEADPQILAAAVGGFLDEALKRCRAGGRVALRATATAERVVIEIEHERGDLPPGEPEAHDLAHEGLGLSVCRRGVAACGGEVRVLDVPGKGGVFTIDLPRQAPPPGHASP